MSADTDFLPHFLKDIERHQLTILRDDGLYRQLWFGRPGTSCMHFQLITWPGHLCYTGDMGTYVFKRLEDMLQFFRREDGARQYRIDFRYWAEKVEAADKSDGLKEFSPEKFLGAVKRDLIEWIRANAGRTTREERRDLWEEVMNDVVDAGFGDPSGQSQYAAANDFRREVKPGLVFRFVDFWDHDTTRYTHRFLWCCHAIAWAIGVYDKAKEAAAEGVAA